MTRTEERPAPTAARTAWHERAGARLVAFALALAVLFGAGLGVGALAGSTTTERAAAPTSGDHAEMAGMGGATDMVQGLATTQDDYTLETLGAPSAANVPGELAFRIVGPTGAPVTAFTPTHDKALHLIVARRDLAGFQHLHPVMDATGTWRTPVTLRAGDYRLLADFAPDGRSEAMTLGRDLPVAGDYQPVPLAAPAATATTPDGYTVTLMR